MQLNTKEQITMKQTLLSISSDTAFMLEILDLIKTSPRTPKSTRRHVCRYARNRSKFSTWIRIPEKYVKPTGASAPHISYAAAYVCPEGRTFSSCRTGLSYRLLDQVKGMVPGSLLSLTPDVYRFMYYHRSPMTIKVIKGRTFFQFSGLMCNDDPWLCLIRSV